MNAKTQIIKKNKDIELEMNRGIRFEYSKIAERIGLKPQKEVGRDE